MAWTNITNAQLAIGAPIRSIDLLALRDNITAQANGDTGAPKQQTAGIADSAVTTAKIANSNVTAQKIKYGSGLTASGDTLIASPASFNSVGSYCYVQIFLNTGQEVVSGGNYAAGNAYGQIASAATMGTYSVNLSGTWKWMGANYTSPDGSPIQAIAVRIA